jgi:hypothetical protein
MTRWAKHRVAGAIQMVLWGVHNAAIVVHAAATAVEDGLYRVGRIHLGSLSGRCYPVSWSRTARCQGRPRDEPPQPW